jgi:pentatricopeptide repeat protein
LGGNPGLGKLSLTDQTNLIEKMARAERLGEATKLTEEMLDRGIHPYPRTLRFLLGRLAAAAEVDVLSRFENKLTPVSFFLFSNECCRISSL